MTLRFRVIKRDNLTFEKLSGASGKVRGASH
jgi:hypothetical protein